MSTTKAKQLAKSTVTGLYYRKGDGFVANREEAYRLSESELDAVRFVYEAASIEAESCETELSEYERGFIDGVTRFAEWRDGRQCVGAAGTPLEEFVDDWLRAHRYNVKRLTSRS